MTDQQTTTTTPCQVEVSVADWTAGYEAGWTAGQHAARTALDEAGAYLARMRPSRAVDTVHARRAQTRPGRRPGEPDHDDPADLAAYRARIYTSWGLTPPPAPAPAPTPAPPTTTPPTTTPPTTTARPSAAASTSQERP